MPGTAQPLEHGGPPRLGPLLALLPHAAAAIWPAWSPARALLLGVLLESLRRVPAGGPARRREILQPLLRQGLAWGVLHSLRADAPALLGLLFLGLFLLLRLLPGQERRIPAGAAATVATAPALLHLVLLLAGRQPPALLQSLDLWQAAAPREAPARSPEEVPEGLATAEIPFALPPRLVPWPLEDSPARPQALVLVAGLALLQGAALAASGRSRSFLLLLGGLVLVPLGRGLGAGPEGVELRFLEGGWHRVQVHAPGADLVDPTAGPLVLPAHGAWHLAREPAGLVRVVAAAPWGQLLAGEAEPPQGEAAAWLEIRPLKAPRAGGPLLEAGGRGILELWLRGEDASRLPPGGIRWELRATGRPRVPWELVRLPLGGA